MYNKKKAIIISGGELATDFLIKQIENRSNNIIISVDSGANALYMGGIVPDVLLGDFDSIKHEVYEYFSRINVKIQKYPKEKNATDTHIGIEYAIENGIQEILLLGGTGTRLDHTLANIFLMEKYIRQISCKMIDQHNSIELLLGEDSGIYEKEHYKYISILPLSKEAIDVTTEGLKYKLTKAKLNRSDSFGVSNEIIGEKGNIYLKEGVLAIIRSKD